MRSLVLRVVVVGEKGGQRSCLRGERRGGGGVMKGGW